MVPFKLCYLGSQKPRQQCSEVVEGATWCDVSEQMLQHATVEVRVRRHAPAKRRRGEGCIGSQIYSSSWQQAPPLTWSLKHSKEEKQVWFVKEKKAAKITLVGVRLFLIARYVVEFTSDAGKYP
ncbi:hypothetical protein NDU88_000883 [Pleurodeles waltl]|uniref:Uncharacterized protein n=1 Tax=Pleurodeles waltl TaxID=8319 RepID=A0AAV7V8D8_PLEWA|nr:hypothetical protein NDU88_000883 [Pleurodeles waltl]